MDGSGLATRYHVKAEWDAEARVWVAFSDDVPGLATGADTFEALVEKLRVVVPEMLAENGLLTGPAPDVPFEVSAVRIEHVRHAA